ncbi:SMP-30/gluconolactonase/LRE family protein [Devosia sp. A369]
MKLSTSSICIALLLSTGAVNAQQAAAPAEVQPFKAGMPVGVTSRDGVYTPASDNVKMYGALVSTESCSYDAERNLIVALNRGAPQDRFPNDAFVSLINHDGSVHTPRWIGANRNGLVLNEPFGSDIVNGTLYAADSDGGTADGVARTVVIRMFDMATGAPSGEIPVPEVAWFNDIEVADDGTIYASQTGGGKAEDPMRIYKITPDGTASVFLDGAPLASPNGVGIDGDGNIVVVNIGDDAVLTFSPEGELLNTEHAAQPGSDGLVIMADGTKYVSSVTQGGISKIVPGQPAELIATGVPSAASMCYDAEANQLVIPLNNNNGLAFLKLD